MIKYVAPLEQRLRHLHVPKRTQPTAVTGHGDRESTGQKLAEHTAAGLGSWAFLGFQACFLALWVILNAAGFVQFDKPPFILLNLLLSFQAAFCAPVLLIAANVGAMRDHKQFDRMEELERHIEDSDELNARRLEAIMARLDEIASPAPSPSPPPPPAQTPPKRSHHKKLPPKETAA